MLKLQHASRKDANFSTKWRWFQLFLMILYFQTMINILTYGFTINMMISRTLIITSVILSTFAAQACFFNLTVVPLNHFLKVCWHNATLFYLFIMLRHTVIHSSKHTSHSLRPLQISSSLSLSREISIGVPGWDSNPGLPYSRPTHYHLSCAALS